MNSLSWFIYAIEVVDSIKFVLTPTIGIAALALVGGTIAALILFNVEWHAYSWDRENGLAGNAKRDAIAQRFRPIIKWGWIIFIPLVLLQVFLPSRQTLLLIAGSEIGEKVTQSRAVAEVVNPGVDLLKAWIKSETDRLTPKSSK
jgi:hypothetical protein